jgi:hypothetical protein
VKQTHQSSYLSKLTAKLDQLKAQKALYSKHTDLSKRLIAEAKQRKLDQLSAWEEHLFQGTQSAETKTQILEYLSTSDVCRSDLLRLLCVVVYACTEQAFVQLCLE